MGADGRIRLFCALQLPDETRRALAAWAGASVPESAGRLVRADDLHVTLAFLGSRPSAEVPPIVAELRAASAGSGPVELHVRRYRETRSVGMLVLDDVDGAAGALAGDVQERLERLGVYRREGRAWLPHVTVARFRERPRLQPPLEGLGPVSPSDAAVYSSVLRPAGAQYVVLVSSELGAGTHTTGGR